MDRRNTDNTGVAEKIIKSGIFVSLATVLTKVIGLLKQMVIAWCYGSGSDTDVYFVAEGFIGPLNVVIFSSITVVLLSEYLYEKDRKEKNILISNMYFIYAIIAVASAALIVLLSPLISRIIAVGYENELQLEVAKYLRWLAVILIFYCIASISGAVLEGEKHFLPTKLQGMYVSLCVILCSITLSKKTGITSLLIGTVLGYLIYMIVNFLYSRKWITINVTNPFHDSRVTKIFRLSVPLIIGNAINEIQMIIDKMIASGFGEGVVSNLYYSQILSYDLISAIFATSLGTIFYSYFVDYASSKDDNSFRKMLVRGVNCQLILTVVIMVLYFASSETIVNLLFNHGSFDSDDVHSTAIIVSGYTVGFAAVAIRGIFIKAHYAFQDTKSPMINGLIATIANTVFSIVFSKFFGPIGIALGTSLSCILVSILSAYTLNKHIKGIDYSAIIRCMGKVIFAAGISAVFILFYKSYFEFEKIITWIFGCVITMLIYFSILKLVKCDELNYSVIRIKRIFTRKKK